MDNAKQAANPKERLLETADQLFYREGVHTVGIDKILAQSGVAKGSLYNTYGSKDALVVAYLQQRARRLEARLEAGLQSRAAMADPREAILAIFDAYAERVAEPDYLGCAFARACAERPLESSEARDVVAAHRTWRHKLFARLLEAANVLDVETATRQLSILFDGTAVCVSIDGDPAAAEATRQAVEMLLDAHLEPRKPRRAAAARPKPRRG